MTKSTELHFNFMVPTFDEQRPPLKRAKLVEASGQNHQSVEMMKSNGQSHANQNGRSTESKESKMEVDAPDKLDSNAYSRQIYAIGESAMLKLRKSSVLICGLGGVGVEIAKNLILGGIRRVGLQDTRRVEWHDLSAQFYLRENQLGENRAEASFQRLEELNDSVQCSLFTDELTEELVSQFDLTILTEQTFRKQIEVNEWARKHRKKFISADACGLFSYSFVDLGPRFQVDDPTGEQNREVLIEFVDRATGNIHTLDGTLHGLEDGDHVRFEEVRGMNELNTQESFEIRVVKPNVFNIGPIPESFGNYEEGGRAKQIKRPVFVDFKSLKDAIESPEFVMWDFAHFEAPQHLHELWQALYSFQEKHKRKPSVRSMEDVELLRNELKSKDIPEEWSKNFAFQATGNLQPVTSLIGGISAQEAMKAITHHTMPQHQFLYTHHLEALPGDYSSLDNQKLTAEDCKPRNNRYDGQAAVFGWKFQEALAQQRWFIVGAGAIGCELLKNFAMIGLGCGEKGEVRITDMDQIELSNLNRQFLFRRKDIGAKKSQVAAAAVKHFNPKLQIRALTERVADDTEHVFTDEFFSSLSGVANALDNVDARRYMDRRCVYYELPLLESGTMGTKANTQVVYPHLTESYSSTNDPPEKDIPICTLKHFPYEIQHTIQWGRGLFEDLFTNPAEKVNQFLSDQRGFLERLEHMNEGQRISDLQILKQFLNDERPKSAEDCIKWARDLFEHHYHNEIAQLLHNFPADQITSTGSKFWSGTKRCPKTLSFDLNDKFHFDFVYAASILRAQQYKFKPITDRNEFSRLASAHQPTPFTPKSNVRIAVTDAEVQAGVEDENNEDSQDEQLKLSLARLQLTETDRLEVIDFEKDDDTNHHVEFVTAASNLRAANYSIEQADAMKTKQISGRIIAALATTTAVVGGLVSLELYKTIEANGKTARTPLERFKNGFLNLAGPFYTFSEPGKAPKRQYGNHEFTLWDRLEIHGPKTLQEILNWIRETTGFEVSMLSSGVSLIYAFFTAQSKLKERMDKNIADVIADVSRKPIPDYRKTLVLDVMATGDNDDDVEIPFIKYYV
ncbi:hypothetical protein M3Y98_00253000 [Aphelenchoides besseyi]|nr:hypothetical protein M3Y98_00253000 [Aphelenchoides besseyi]KAI6200789.1 hypothetical protein M3Y96_00771700 [Aphelenchoides besseyi]